MIDVFIRLGAQHPVRSHIAAAVWARWKMEPDIRLHGIAMRGFTDLSNTIPIEFNLPLEDFCWKSRIYADEHAEGRFYIITDDDHLILGKDWALRAYDGMKNGYAMMSANSVVRGEQATGIYGGCPAIVLRGAVEYHKFLGHPPNHQDTIISDEIICRGFLKGYIPGLDYLHCGFGLSEVEPRCWLTY